MSFVEEFRAESQNNTGSYPDHDEVAHELGAKQVSFEILDTRRWGQDVEYVYQRGDEFVSVIYYDGSGDSDIEYSPKITAVRPVEKTVVTYLPF